MSFKDTPFAFINISEHHHYGHRHDSGCFKLWKKTNDMVRVGNFLPIAEILKTVTVYRSISLPLPLMSNRIPCHEKKRVDFFISSPQKLPVGGNDPQVRFQCDIWRLLHLQSYIK